MCSTISSQQLMYSFASASAANITPCSLISPSALCRSDYGQQISSGLRVIQRVAASPFDVPRRGEAKGIFVTFWERRAGVSPLRDIARRTCLDSVFFAPESDAD
ncbi:hypothetical protein HN011_003828 [Eciton burchellii]|nr:hypothetical protein HN011_003828 [Eciton burchellii]